PSPQKTPAPSPQKTPAPSLRRSPVPPELPKPVPRPRVACRSICDQAVRCLRKGGDPISFVARCQLRCYAITSAEEQRRFARTLAMLCKPTQRPMRRRRQLSCSELCIQGWRCLPKRSQLLFDSPNTYLGICQPDCERVKNDPKAFDYKRQQLTRGCRLLEETPRRRKPSETTKRSCLKLCRRSYSCLTDKQRAKESRIEYVGRCLSTCESMRRDERRFRAVIRSVELMCKQRGR
ncbi:MAG: hypothetical protein KC609_06555, partial [Myxococcales bacterium]|nr:hypothetical protein [Myxococcales bacterium]